MTPLEILARIDAHTLATEDNEKRTWLGASEIGDRCVRRIWLKFRWCGQEKFDGRMLRLFARGDREEPVFDNILRGAGFEVEVPTPEDKERFQFVDCESHFRGTCDGAILIDEEWCLLEKKTYSAKNFADLKRCGVKENDPKYWSQCTTYMGELGFTRCLFCAVSKDSDELYFEYLDYDEAHFHVCLNKAERIINSPTPPERISNDPKSFTCRYCHFNRLCHENIPLAPLHRSCRNCVSGSPAQAGTWVCGKGHTFGTVCQDYQAVTGG